jgi:hypothetical protein
VVHAKVKNGLIWTRAEQSGQLRTESTGFRTEADGIKRSQTNKD